MTPIDSTKLGEPVDFDKKCRQKGLLWLANNPKATRKKNKRPADYWTPFKSDLADSFRDLCAYSAMHEPIGTVDHFTPVHANEKLTYEWKNYRFASAWLNSCKNKAPKILDPLIVGSGWFEILLPSLQMVIVRSAVPAHLQALAEETLTLLHLRDDERIVRQRRRWYRLYQENKLTLDGLREMAPLIAIAVEKRAIASVVK